MLDHPDAARQNPPVKPPIDEGGLRAPPGLSFWRKAWWWFDFIILVKLARLRFIAILAIIGLVIHQWGTLVAWYEKWTRPSVVKQTSGSGFEYFCPMHLTIVRDSPKEKCPICFMPLSKRKKGAARREPLTAGTVSRVQLSPYRVVLAGVETWPAGYVELTKEIVAVGYVEFNERAQRTVSARVEGRLDTLYVNETGQMVGAGDALASLYSPELLVTMQNLLNARRGGNQELAASNRTKLKLLGIDDDQIDDVLESGKANTHLTIRSPIGGHVIKKYVREGQYVQEGSPLYDVADLSTVWIQAQVYEDDLTFLPSSLSHARAAVGPAAPSPPAASSSPAKAAPLPVTATTRSFPGEDFHGLLTFIYPHVDLQSRTVTVRFELDNPGHKLRPGATATVRLRVPPTEVQAIAASAAKGPAREKLRRGLVLSVPESAVIDTGNRTIVYRQASPGVFEGVTVVLGPRMTGPQQVAYFPVLRGLADGERVVTSGSFLVDAETRLNPAAGSIYFGGSGGSQPSQDGATTVRPSTPEEPGALDGDPEDSDDVDSDGADEEDGEAVIVAALARLSSSDRATASAQRFCPILSQNRLGAMGRPVKLLIEGQPVFLCCPGCKKKALARPKETLAKVEKLRRRTMSEDR